MNLKDRVKQHLNVPTNTTSRLDLTNEMSKLIFSYTNTGIDYLVITLKFLKINLLNQLLNVSDGALRDACDCAFPVEKGDVGCFHAPVRPYKRKNQNLRRAAGCLLASKL